MKRAIPALAALAVCWSVAAPASAGPANLCALNLKPQLKPLGVSPLCKAAKTANVGPLTIAGADWGATNDFVGVQVYTGAPQSRFEKQFGTLGKPVALGVFAREDVGPSGVTVSAWVNGKGLVILLDKGVSTSSKMSAYAVPVLAFAKAVAKQL